MNDNIITITNSPKLRTTTKAPKLDPELAVVIARHVNARQVASDMVTTVLNRKVFNQEDFDYWKGEHMESTAELWKLGIKLHTFREDNETEEQEDNDID